MAHKKQREFIKLTVDELSLVDSPAIEEEFIVTKRLEESDMADNKAGNTQASETASTEDTQSDVAKSEAGAVESVPVEVAKADNEAVEKAMEQVTKNVEEIVKSAKDAIADAGASEEGVEKGKMPKDVFKAELEKAGIKGDELKKALEKFDKAMGGKDKVKKATEDSEPEVETEKSKQSEADEGEVAMKTLGVLEDAIQKAKTFTPKRQAKLQKVLDELKSVLDEVSGSTSTTKKEDDSVSKLAGIEEVTKKLDELKEAISKQNETSEKTVKELTDRVETIEKTRNPSTSVEDDGGTDTQETKKGFWSGVL